MASPIQATGVGSNLDVNGLVEKLMAVEQQPLVALQKKEAAVSLKISSFATYRGALASFQGTLVELEKSSIYSTVKATVGDSAVASATSVNGADPGSHSLEVSQLALAHRLKSDGFASIGDRVGTGSITIEYGAFDGTNFTSGGTRPSQTIQIDDAHASLSGVRDAINASKGGVTASIVNDGGTNGNRLVLTSKDTGTKSSLKITVTEQDASSPTDALGLSKLAYDPTLTAGTGKNMIEVNAAKDALFKLDGLDIASQTNTVTGALQGTTINLLKTNANAATTLEIGQDTTSVKKAVDDFVKFYNDLNKTATDLTAYDKESKTAAALQGDSSIRAISSQLRDALGSVVRGVEGGYAALTQVGITLDKTGNLAVDSGKLETALKTNPQAVQDLFATGARIDDPAIKYQQSSATTPAGNYAVNISQIATQGSVVGQAGTALAISDTNNALTLSVDGVTTSVTLTNHPYASRDALATELQKQINGASALSSAGISVKVSADAMTGALTLTSNKYGAASKIVLSGGSAQADLFGALPATSNGVDVGGSIGGLTGSGSGRDLLSPNGLGLTVEGGATGDRGNVRFSRGIAVQLDDLIGKALGTKGLIQQRTDSFNASVKQLQADQTKLNGQLEVKQQRYLKQFNTLDGLLSNMQSQMSYLSQQLSALNNK